jgi:amidophosphoribosyltransferase
MCGVVGVVSQKEVSPAIYDALTILQHRGQDAAGIATSTHNRFFIRKQLGLVRDVIRSQHMLNLRGQMGIGHVRYPTSGSEDRELAQPMYVNSPFGISISHNGNLNKDLRHLNTDSDSEILLNVFAHELQKQGSIKPGSKEIFAAVRALHKRVRGAYSVVIMINGVGIVGFRDPFGIRPLMVGSKERDLIGSDYVIASESTVLDYLGYETIDDIQAGSAVFISADGVLETESCIKNPIPTPCIFEYVYLARPDATIDKISVHKSRLRMGEYLANKIMEQRPEHDIDVVIPIPDSSTTSALQLASTLGIKYREGFVKNRYIGRTFIMPFQEKREKSVKQKLNPIGLEFQDKVVLLVDDSIVRGTTSRQIIEMARSSGAKKVYFASAAPPIRYQNVYGIDMAATTELVAHKRTEKEVEEFIKADWLIYQDLDDLVQAAQIGNEAIKQFECSIFNGKYVTDDIDDKYLKDLEDTRNDKSKASRQLS